MKWTQTCRHVLTVSGCLLLAAGCNRSGPATPGAAGPSNQPAAPDTVTATPAEILGEYKAKGVNAARFDGKPYAFDGVVVAIDVKEPKRRYEFDVRWTPPDGGRPIVVRCDCKADATDRETATRLNTMPVGMKVRASGLLAYTGGETLALREARLQTY